MDKLQLNVEFERHIKQILAEKENVQSQNKTLASQQEKNNKQKTALTEKNKILCVSIVVLSLIMVVFGVMLYFIGYKTAKM